MAQILMKKRSGHSFTTILASILMSVIILVSIIQYRYIPNKHEVFEHGAQSALAIMCLNKNGTNSAYRFYEHGEERRAWTCYEDKEWYILFTDVPKETNNVIRVESRTSYMLENQTIEEWEVDRLVNGFVRINESIPASSVGFPWILALILAPFIFIKSKNRTKNKRKKS